jgi:hypothetical protein
MFGYFMLSYPQASRKSSQFRSYSQRRNRIPAGPDKNSPISLQGKPVRLDLPLLSVLTPQLAWYPVHGFILLMEVSAIRLRKQAWHPAASFHL